ncbi:MAG: selenide, water dikinase SelD [Candidatus Zixiibacteriota bacterium]
MGPKFLAEVLTELPVETNPNLLVGFNKADDAGIYKISEKQALVQTVDFFPPIVDDPYAFGQIAAANALSDIYAMGGTPLTALNIVGFPAGMNPKILTEILRGGSDKIHEAEAAVVGGHSIKDKELKYGVACTGIIDIDKIIKNDGARPGDILFLTKRLGTGIITTAIKQNRAALHDINLVTAQMAQLNRAPAELMVKHGAHAATDITGFGLLGHAFEMADASGVSIEFEFSRLPLLPNAVAFARAGALTGGAGANRDYLTDKAKIAASLKKEETDILFDAQTSGGLLIAFDKISAAAFQADAADAGIDTWQIGRVIEKSGPAIIVI